MNDVAVQDHVNWLQDRLSAYESKLSEAEATVTKLRPIVTNLRGTIEALVSDDRGPTPSRDLFGQSLVNDGPTPKSRPTAVKPFAQGNQNPNLPARRPEFAESTLIEAAGRIINATPDEIHADVVTEAVFEASDRAGFLLAKRSMSSEIYRGSKNGLWNRLGDNWYRRK